MLLCLSGRAWAAATVLLVHLTYTQTSLPVPPSRGPRPTLELRGTLTLGLNTLSWMSEYAVLCLNCPTPGLQSSCRTLELPKTFYYIFSLSSMIPWYHFHSAKDPYSSFWGENVGGSWLWTVTCLDSNSSTTYCMTL